MNHRLQQVARDYQPGEHLKEGTQIFILFFWSSKRCKKKNAPNINKDGLPPSVLMYSIEIFHLLVEQTKLFYQQHSDGQAGPSRQLPDVTTFIALVLQMGHELKDILHDYWLRHRQLHTAFTRP
jgi:hypothetical protein